jgi:hypothetical protein
MIPADPLILQSSSAETLVSSGSAA